MRKVAATIILLCLSLIASAEEYENYCFDKSVDQEWKELLLEHPHSVGLKNLANLRSRLCTRVINGDLPIDAAIGQFEAAREKLLDKWDERNKQRMINVDEVA